jgi:hypothetical protein
LSSLFSLSCLLTLSLDISPVDLREKEEGLEEVQWGISKKRGIAVW